MKKYINIAILVAALSFVGMFISLVVQNNKLKENVEVYNTNFKALNLELDETKNQAIMYKFNVEQLEYLNDSIITDLNNTRKELGIKDKQLKQMQNIKTEITTKDSIFVRDTIFRNNFVKLDTLLGNKWYTVKLGLEYPNKITLHANYKTNMSVFAYSSKEILGIKKKCAIGRFFQKKHKIIRVEIKDMNPYAVIKESKYIIIEK